MDWAGGLIPTHTKSALPTCGTASSLDYVHPAALLESRVGTLLQRKLGPVDVQQSVIVGVISN